MSLAGSKVTRARALLASLLLFGPSSGAVLAQGGDDAGWRQWGGAARDFVVDAGRLADSWPAQGPPVLWSRPLGTGHSAVLAADGRLFTLYRAGNGRGREGPWETEETVVALDAATGETIWEYSYPSRLEDTSFGSGPHATPLLVDGRLFAPGTNKQLHALDAASGELLWSHDLVAEFDAPPLLVRPRVKAGYGCSPVAFRETIICSVGGPGQAVMSFRQQDGAVVWTSGDFLVSEAPPRLVEVDGQTQLVVLGGGTLNGLDPETGRILWTHPHDPGNDFNFMVPLWGDDNIVFVSSGYKTGSRALRLSRDGASTEVEELWFDPQLQFMFLNPIRVGNTVYGSDGTFGPAFMTGVDVRTGETLWQERGFARSSLVSADGKVIIMDEDGDLALARMTPDGMTVLARVPLFETVSWTAPTLVGTTLYVRDREQIVALNLGAE